MSESQVAIAVSIIPILFTGISAWLTQRTRADLLKLRQDIQEGIERRYVRKDVYEADQRRIDERLEAVR